MRHIIRSLSSSLFFYFLLPVVSVAAEITYMGNGLMVENALFSKTFFFSSKGPGAFGVSSVKDKTSHEELLLHATPYFEIGINNSVVNASDPVWQYKRHSTRAMPNDGTELKLEMEVVKGPAKGLIAVVLHQSFRTTTLIREQLTLEAAPGKKYLLHKINGKLHLKFPQYAVKLKNNNTEIRIATWGKEKLDFDKKATYDDRKMDGGAYFNLSQCHMFHPDVRHTTIDGHEAVLYKGPINITGGNDGSKSLQWVLTYEHASQDNLEGFAHHTPALAAKSSGSISVDDKQGVEGAGAGYKDERDLWMLALYGRQLKGGVQVGVTALRGAYLHGEAIVSGRPYATVWTASGFYRGEGAGSGKPLIHDYLMNRICEKPASRRPEFYYNTWGMQRELSSRGHDIRGLFTEKRVLEEINHAGELGVQLFVLDDGWEQAHGIWTPHDERLPGGLAPLREAMEKRGMKMGVWFSPMGIDSATERYRQHRNKVITGAGGVPIKAQWGHPAFDFVSDFYDIFISDCKKLLDEGVLFMKWDAINSFYSTLPNLHHGSEKYTARERMDRYDYLLPIYVTRAMKELTDYQPELVIEIDLTETERCMVGLAPLSEGKFFWMNNGASGYNDYSNYRAKSMRSIADEYAGIVPYELFTFANYPHNPWPFFMQRYNVNTSLLAGHGFWGNLELMTQEQRLRVGKQVQKAMRVLPYLTNTLPQVIGRVGSAPEVYTLMNTDTGAGQVIAFSAMSLRHRHAVAVSAGKVLAVINHAYRMQGDSLVLNLEFSMPDDTREAFILPRIDCDFSILSSDVWLDEVTGTANMLRYLSGDAGIQEVFYHTGSSLQNAGFPEISGAKLLGWEQKDQGILLKIQSTKQEVIISNGN